MRLADPKRVDDAWRSIDEHLENARCVIGSGPEGSGRRALLAKATAEGYAAVDCPSLGEPDAAVHVLLQLAAAAGVPGLELAQRSGVTLADRTVPIIEGIKSGGRFSGVVIRLPDDPPRIDRDTTGVETLAGLKQLRHVVTTCRRVGLSLMLLGGFEWDRRLNLGDVPIVQLRAPGLAPSPQLEGFGKLAPIAERLKNELSSSSRPINPLELRWRVGLARLEEDAGTSQRSPSDLNSRALCRRFAEHLIAREHLQVAILRLASARRSLPRAQALGLIADADDHDLILECAAYGDEQVQMHGSLRRSLLDLSRGMLTKLREKIHPPLAEAHKALNGTPSLSDSPSVPDWLEHAHHLALGGAATAGEWRKLNLRCRELYWDRGKALSLAKSYDQAVEIFQECLDKFGHEDHYAQHYLAFNLDRAGREPAKVKSGFTRAIELDPDNVWWNTRLVTFLIAQSRFLEGRRAWLEALERIDPTGERVERDPWIIEHFHRWVIRGWLEVGEVELAREVLDAIPTSLEEQAAVVELSREVLDAEEARTLGESVYPAHVDPSRRWIGPAHVAPKLADGSELRQWYPGRIVEANATHVGIVFATSSGARRTKVKELTADEWAAATGRPAEGAHGYIEVGVYDGDRLRIELVGSEEPRRRDPNRELRYLRPWA